MIKVVNAVEISWSVGFELANRFGGHIQSGEGKEKETQSMPDKEESGKESAKESDVTATTKAALASHWLTSNGHSYWSTSAGHCYSVTPANYCDGERLTKSVSYFCYFPSLPYDSVNRI